MTYFFDHEWQHERERLRQLEGFFDPLTHTDVEALGIRPGWRCLEIGAGGGSIAEWLAWRVGPTGRVVATDLETRFLDPLEAPNLEVRKHQIGVDPIEEGMFDLIHARAVMEHLPDREPALKHMIAALRPGGWLLLESADFCALTPMDPQHDQLFERCWTALKQVLEERGFQPECGRRLSWELRRLGLEDVEFQGRLFEWGGPGTLTSFYTQTFERLAMAVTEGGKVSKEELDTFLDLCRAPEFRSMSHITCSVRGRKART